MKKFRLRKFHFGFITFFILIYMEVVNRILTHVSIFNNSIWYVLIFSLFIIGCGSKAPTVITKTEYLELVVPLVIL